jgi:hypothetical protein
MYSEVTKKFIFESTADGSPTVRIVVDSAQGALSEAMHSLKGAFSETVYIYGEAIETSLKREFSPAVLSMGLGLGYVELLAAALFLKSGVLASARGVSYEIVPELRAWFQAWLLGDDASGVPAEFQNAYSEILHRVSAHVGSNAGEVRDALKMLVGDRRWLIKDALGAETEFNQRFTCICFDAFSAKTSPVLWKEEFLKSFLKNAAEESCVLSTYACTGTLKRALRDSGFKLDIRTGFASKRDSTFAVRTACS